MHRFLQGPETDQATVSKIRDAIQEQKAITVQLINYTKSGELWLLISINTVWGFPIFVVKKITLESPIR